MTLTNEQIEFLTGGNSDTQTGLPEPENTIQVIRSLNDEDVYDIDFEQLIVIKLDTDTGYVVRFNTLQQMYEFVAYTIG